MNVADFRQEARELFNDNHVTGAYGMSLQYDDVENTEEAFVAWSKGLSPDMYVRGLIESIVYPVDMDEQDRLDALFVRTRGRLPNWGGD